MAESENRLRNIIENYNQIKREGEYKVYDHRYGRYFSESEINGYLILVLILQAPVILLAAVFVLTNIYFLIFVGIPTLIPLSFILFYSIRKYIIEKFYINTNYGKSEITIKTYKRGTALFIYFNKLSQNTNVKKNIFSYLFPKNRPRFTRLVIIKDSYRFLRNLLTYIKDRDDEPIDIVSIIENADLDAEYYNLEEKEMKKININTAKVSQLKKIPFIGKTNAVNIANYIRKKGEFDTIWDFAEFMNLSQDKFETLYKYIIVQKTTKNASVAEQIQKDMSQFDNTLDIL